jgi:type IV fimbrial biogenesis protein FimT
VDRMSRKFSCRGLTLIELMITLVILGVTVTMATPAMQQLIQSSRLRAETTRLLDAINLARSEAVLRNVAVSLCPSSMAYSGIPACSGDFSKGWIVFTNRNRDRVIDTDSDSVIRAFEPIPSGFSLTNLAGSRPIEELITYLPDGSSRRNLSLLVCPPNDMRLEPWRVVLSSVGRARAAKVEGRCPENPL